MAVSVRDNLNDNCRQCGKALEDADEVAPVARGRWSMGPDWSCGGCLP